MKDYAQQNELKRHNKGKRHGWAWTAVWFVVSLMFWHTLGGALL